MSESIIMAVVAVAVLFVLFVTLMFTQSMSRANTFYGVQLARSYREFEPLRRLHRRFQWQTGLLFVPLASVAYGWLASRVEANPLWLVACVGLAVVVLFGHYLRFHFAAVTYKLAHADEQSVGSGAQQVVRHVDLPLLQWKTKWQEIATWAHLLPAVASLMTLIYVVIQYDRMPEMIATHWNALGEADAFAPKNVATVLIAPALHLFLCGLMMVLARGLFTVRSRIHPTHADASRRRAKTFLLGTSISLYLFNWFFTVFMIFVNVARVENGPLPLAVTWSMLVLLLIAVMNLMIIRSRTRAPREEAESATATEYLPEKDDRFWKWGTFYHNPDDSAFLVEKRFGDGWTINTGSRQGRWLIIGIWIFLTFMILMLLY